MFKNYIKFTLRNLRKQKIYSLINISGLALGMACFLLISLFIQFQFSFDQFQKNKDNIYLIYREGGVEGRIERRANIGAPLAPLLLQNFPEIKNAVRFSFFSGVVHYQQKWFTERLIFSDPSLFSVFSFSLKVGDVKTALNEPFSIILSEDMASKYFGDENPVGKILSFKTGWADKKFDFKVMGVLNKIPENSHLQFDFLASYESLHTMMNPDWLTNHWDSATLTYIQLRENNRPDNLEKLLVGFTDKYVDKIAYTWLKLKLLPLKEVYSRSAGLSGFQFTSSGDIRLISVIFGSLALFILLIACINFMNLSTARSAMRAREVGIRKVVGATRTQLIGQFLGESLLFSLLALLFALLLVELLLPYFNNFAGITLSINYQGNFAFILFMLLTAVAVGIVSGSYPAFFLSAFNPIKVLKGVTVRRSSNAFRKILVVFQFTISVVLIFGSIVILKQINFVRHKDLGFDKEHIVVVPINDKAVKRNYESLKSELVRESSILNVTTASQVPGVTSQNGIMIKSDGVEDVLLGIVYTNFDYMTTLGLRTVEGRFPNREIATDANQAVLMNQTALKKLNWQTGAGKPVELYFKSNGRIEKFYSGTIIGVINDFNFRSLTEPVQPVLFKIDPGRCRYMLIRIDGNRLDLAIAAIRKTLTAFAPDQPEDFYFLDQRIDQMYRWFYDFGKMVRIATIISIFISCLGLFGLAFFATERRVKEIGIRKTLGASVPGVVTLLSKDFLKLVLIGNIVAWPLAYFLMKQMLQNFAYRIQIGADIFLLASVLSMIVACCTVSYQSVKAALANPVDALRYE